MLAKEAACETSKSANRDSPQLQWSNPTATDSRRSPKTSSSLEALAAASMMKAAFLSIGLILVMGGIAGLVSDKPLTLFPNGSKVTRAVTISEETKKGLGIAAVLVGLGVITAALRRSGEPVQASVPAAPDKPHGGEL
jgi:hypothetical protein